MPSLKYKLLKVTIPLSLLIIGGVSGSVLFPSQAAAAAATPGCYVQSVTNSKGKQTTHYQLQDNTACGQNGNDPTSNCYVAPAESGPYKRVACSSINSKYVTGYRISNAAPTKNQCGSGNQAIQTSINFGCKGQSCTTNHPDVKYCNTAHSAVTDVVFAIIRFLSYGVGLVVVGSIVVAGIQYTTSQGDPQATAAAEKRIKATMAALLIYIFSYAILNYVIPAGFFNQ